MSHSPVIQLRETGRQLNTVISRENPSLVAQYVEGIIAAISSQADLNLEPANLDGWIELIKQCLIAFPFSEAYSIARIVATQQGIQEDEADKAIEAAKSYALQEIVICSSSQLSTSWKALATKSESIADPSILRLAEKIKQKEITEALNIFIELFVSPLAAKGYLDIDSPKDWVLPFIKMLRIYDINLDGILMDKNFSTTPTPAMSHALMKSLVFADVQQRVERVSSDRELRFHTPEITDALFQIMNLFTSEEAFKYYYPVIIGALVESMDSSNLIESNPLSFNLSEMKQLISALESYPSSSKIVERLQKTGWRNTPMTSEGNPSSAREIIETLVKAGDYHHQMALFEVEAQDHPYLEILPGMRIHILQASNCAKLPPEAKNRIYAPISHLHKLIFNRDWEMDYTPESSAQYLDTLMSGDTGIDTETQERLLVVMNVGGVIIGGNVVSMATNSETIFRDLATSLSTNYQLVDEESRQARELREKIDEITNVIYRNGRTTNLEINELFADRQIGMAVLNRIFTNLDEILDPDNQVNGGNINSTETRAALSGLQALKLSFIDVAREEGWRMEDICKEAFRFVTLILNKAVTTYAMKFLEERGVDPMNAQSVQWTASSSKGEHDPRWKGRNRMESIFRLFTKNKTKLAASAVGLIGRYTNQPRSQVIADFAQDSDVLWEGPIIHSNTFNEEGTLRNAPPSNWPIIIGMPLVPFDAIVGDLKLYMALFRQKYLELIKPERQPKKIYAAYNLPSEG